MGSTIPRYFEQPSYIDLFTFSSIILFIPIKMIIAFKKDNHMFTKEVDNHVLSFICLTETLIHDLRMLQLDNLKMCGLLINKQNIEDYLSGQFRINQNPDLRIPTKQKCT